MYRGQPIIVEWSDSMAHGRWESDGDYREPNTRCVSVGLYYGKTKRVLTICTNHAYGDEHNNAQYGDFMNIPLGCIRSYRRLK